MKKKLALIAWALYDWASSSYASVIQTFIFASYFTRSVAANEIQGSSEWGLTMGLAGIIIALCSPLLGAIADHKGHRKGWMAIFYLLCLISTVFLWYVKPTSSDVPLALTLIFLGTIGSEFAFIFYNAMLPDLIPKQSIGTWSGIGWGMGYVGGVSCLLLAYLMFLNGQHSWWLLNNSQQEQVRAIFLFTALWYGLFGLPVFIFAPNSEVKTASFKEAINLGFNQLSDSFKQFTRYKNLFWFLLARMIYTDGLTTVFLFGGVYATGTFGMTPQDVLIFAIALNIAAGIGAFSFAWLDDLFGSLTVIKISVIGLALSLALALWVTSLNLFWIFTLILGLFVGPLQASSRAFMAKIVPKQKLNQMFGLFSFSGKATGFVGSLLVSFVTLITQSQRLGLATIIPFFLAGFLIILKLPSKQNHDYNL